VTALSSLTIGFRRRALLKAAGVAAASMLAVVGPASAESDELHNFEQNSEQDSEGHPVSINATGFQPAAGTDAVPFTRYDGSLFGLQQANSFTPADFFPPFFNGGGISSGDIDRDGWPDVVSANGTQINIFMNQGGQSFEKLELDVSGNRYAAIFNIALVDINGDGWLDLFGTSYMDGNFYLLSDKGKFTKAGLKKPHRGQAVLSLATSFGDVDRDGDLDVIVGNWFAGMAKQHPPPRSQNELWINQGTRFEVTPLAELVGETLSTLLSDWNGDGKLDLIVGNDFDVPDFYYLGDGKGGFERIERQAGIIPHSTHSTMSIDTGDFDNDLDLDIFLDQITARATGPSARMPVLPLNDYCNDIEIATELNRCLSNMAIRRSFFYGPNHRPDNVRKCAKAATNEIDRQACVGMQVMMTAQRELNPELCEMIPQSESRTYSMCRNFFEPVSPHNQSMLERSIPQHMNENVLLVRDSSTGRFTDEAGQAGVGFTGWSWNARFADVDNDEWQDIYVVAGSWFRATPSGTTANFFFHNEAGKKFSDQTDAFGLQNNMIVSAYTVVDFDRDGDLDFVTNSINGPLWLLRNNARGGNSIVFQLRDEVGNRDGIGTKFTIHYGNGGQRHQIRELKASGGYLSFDEPSAHFGLGEYDQIERFEVNWSTGGSTEFPGPFKAGHIYSLRRFEKK
jgi:hypothetical protein